MGVMGYAAAIEGLLALAGELHGPPGAPRRKFRLEDMRVLLEALGEPQSRFPSVLIAGTNGKGSTAATLASIFRCAGYCTGLYTSPHLSRVNERIQIHGAPIGDDDFAAHYDQVRAAAEGLTGTGRLPGLPSFFETLTAMGFLAFAAGQVEIAVLEVGMGGRLDATNVVEPLLSIITDISLDHTEWLGSTVAEIAREKAGILRRCGVMVTLPQLAEANQALGEAAVALEVRGVNAAEYLPAGAGRSPLNCYPLRVLGETIQVETPLAGAHQQRNVALAIAAAVEIRNSSSYIYSNNDGYKLTARHIEAGIRGTRWPGRLERFRSSGEVADVLMDVAHNPAGTWALRAALAGMAPGKGMTLVFGCLRDKAVDEMAQILFPLFDRVILVEVDSPRTAAWSEMAAAAEKTGVPFERGANAAGAMLAALRSTPADGLVVVAGSVYLVGEARERLPGVVAAIHEPARARG